MSNINKSDKSNSKVFSRKELYDLVWSKPLTQIAKDYGFSDNGIRKICKKYNIPLPKAGYWAKLRHNKKFKKEKLPKQSDNPEIKLEKTNPDLYAGNTVQSKIAIRKRELESIESLSFKVPHKLSKPHIHIKNTKEYFKKVDEAEKKGRGRYSVDSSRALSINVSKQHRARALRIFDSIIKILENQGYKFTIDNESKVITSAESYSISIRETNKRVKKESKYSWDSYDYVPTGKLCLKVYRSYPLKEWTDSETKPLEEKLINIVAWLEVQAKEDNERALRLEKERIENENKRKKEEALQKLKDEELTKFEGLFHTATRWHKSQYIKNYIKEFEKYALESNTFDIEKKQWISWAKEKADWYDPFIEKDVELLEDVDRDTLKAKGENSWY